MYFRIWTIPGNDPDLSWTLAKNPASPPYERDIGGDGARKVVGRFLPDGAYELVVENDGLAFMEQLRRLNAESYNRPEASCVCPANLVALTTAFRSAIYGKPAGGASPEAFAAPKHLEAIMGPFPLSVAGDEEEPQAAAEASAPSPSPSPSPLLPSPSSPDAPRVPVRRAGRVRTVALDGVSRHPDLYEEVFGRATADDLWSRVGLTVAWYRDLVLDAKLMLTSVRNMEQALREAVPEAERALDHAIDAWTKVAEREEAIAGSAKADTEARIVASGGAGVARANVAALSAMRGRCGA